MHRRKKRVMFSSSPFVYADVRNAARPSEYEHHLSSKRRQLWSF
jgi:hypothetical protein